MSTPLAKISQASLQGKTYCKTCRGNYGDKGSGLNSNHSRHTYQQKCL
jgi:hypothetical protein